MITIDWKRVLSYLTLPRGIRLGEVLWSSADSPATAGEENSTEDPPAGITYTDCMVSGITRGDSMITCKNYILGGVTSDCRVNYP